MTDVIHHKAQFYKSLAFLFYAVAAVDHKIVLQEKCRIKELVDQDWSFMADDIDSREIIFSTLKEVIAENYDKEEAFKNFKSFFLEHRSEFPDDIKNKILDGADSITVAFAKRNKSESVLISRLFFLLWK